MGAVEATKNRWLVATSTMAIHLSIGSVYAYSVYQNPLQETQGWSIGEVTMGFTVAIFTVGLASAALGRYVKTFGPRASGLAAAVLFGGGTVLAGAAVQVNSYPGFLLTFGLVAGVGLGIGYVSPIPTLVKWFPDRRGLATGLAVMGFGAGALVTAPAANYLLTTTDVPTTFYVLGVGYFLTMAAGASYLEDPPEGWVPAGTDPDEVTTAADGRLVEGDLEHLTAGEAIRTPQFYLLWMVVFVNISAGIALLAVASNMTQAITGATAGEAATVVGVVGIFNGAGRIGWSSLSDYVGRTNTYAAFFLLQIPAFLLLPNVTSLWPFAGLLFLIVTCYGGGFACMPAYLADLFGTEDLAAIHGYTLTAWSLAGVVGPTLVSRVVDLTGSYELSFYAVGAMLVVGLVCVGVLQWRIGVVRRAKLGGTPHGLSR